MNALFSSISAFDGLADALTAALWRGFWQGSLALIFVGAICRFVPRLPAAAKCWLWRLAFARLLFAFFVPASLPLAILPAPPAPVIANEVSGGRGQGSAWQSATGDRQQGAIPNTQSPNHPITESLSHPYLRPLTPDPHSIAALLYVAGLAFCLVRLGVSWRRAQGLMMDAYPVTDTLLLAEYAETARRLRLYKTLALMASPEGNGPALVAHWGGAAVLLPEELLSAEASLDSGERRLILAHELAHAKRRDLAWEWLGVAAQTLFFFSPLIYWARREERAAREMACDALALSATGATPAVYGRALVNVAARVSLRPALAGGIGVVGAVEKGSVLMRRMENLRSASGGVSRAAAFGIAAFVVVGLLPYRLTAQTSPAPAKGSAEAQKQGKTQEFRGVAVTESGKPVPGAVVRWLTAVKSSRRWKMIAETKADAQERFRFRLVPPSAIGLDGRSEFSGQWVALSADGRFGSLLTMNLDRTNEIRLTLPGKHEAQFLTTGKKPIAGLPVKVDYVSGDGGTVSGDALRYISGVKEGKTDADGKFLVTGMPAGMWTGFSYDSDDWALQAQQVIPGRPLFRIRYALVPAATITGTVLLPDGKPAANVTVNGNRIKPNGTAVWEGTDVYQGGWAKTDAQGRYTMRRLVPGRYQIGVRSERPSPSFVARPITVETSRENPAKNADFPLNSGGLIEGIVTNAATGKPLPGILMAAGTVMDGGNGITDNDYTDTKGAYRLRVPPGRAFVQQESPPSGLQIAATPRREITIKEGETVRVDYALFVKPATFGETKINGVVRDAGGKPVVGAEIRFPASLSFGEGHYNGSAGRFATDSAGRFAAWVNFEDVESVRVIARKGDDAGETTVVPGGEKGVEIRIARKPPATLRGVVTDNNARPVPGAMVETLYEDNAARNMKVFLRPVTDKQGRFSITVWPEYQYKLWVRAKGHGFALFPKEVKTLLRTAPGETVDIGRISLAASR